MTRRGLEECRDDGRVGLELEEFRSVVGFVL